MDAINYLGYQRRDFIKFVNYRLKRFKTKLLNAYDRFVEETSELDEQNIDRHIKRMNNIINESVCDGYDLRWSLESIYDF